MQLPQQRQLEHGARLFDGVRITGYSLELQDGDGFVGDKASQSAFREILSDLTEHVRAANSPAFDELDIANASHEQLDRLALGHDSTVSQTIMVAVADFATSLADVIDRFRAQTSWRDVQRIALGGGFKESAVGRLAIRQASHLLAQRGRPIGLRTVHFEADDAGLVGWANMLPHGVAESGDAFLAIDIGGTNVRCGVVQLGPKLRVSMRDKWKHSEDGAQQTDLVEGIVAMLRRMIEQAASKQVMLAPFIGIACPGVVSADGSILRGAQNLPGDWNDASFHLPRRLTENIPTVRDRPTLALLHNDAVAQGMSELPFMSDVRRWAILTIGTGLGNASFENVAAPAVPSSGR
jgi:hypothetical protein